MMANCGQRREAPRDKLRKDCLSTQCLDTAASRPRGVPMAEFGKQTKAATVIVIATLSATTPPFTVAHKKATTHPAHLCAKECREGFSDSCGFAVALLPEACQNRWVCVLQPTSYANQPVHTDAHNHPPC